jgi:hypothetical protein
MWCTGIKVFYVVILASLKPHSLQVCRSGLSANRRIWLTRHGESEFNRLGLVGGDAPLTDLGRKYATTLAHALIALVPMPDYDPDSNPDELLPISCWTSTLKRTIQSAKHIPFPKLRWKALDEIHAGAPHLSWISAVNMVALLSITLLGSTISGEITEDVRNLQNCWVYIPSKCNLSSSISTTASSMQRCWHPHSLLSCPCRPDYDPDSNPDELLPISCWTSLLKCTIL